MRVNTYLAQQGNEWKKLTVAVFFSAKLNPAQQNHPVHDILQGAQFKWLTDHRGLEYLFTQKDLSRRQAQWVLKCFGFDFEIIYFKGTGMVCSRSEYSFHDVVNNNILALSAISIPVAAGPEARAITRSARSRAPVE